MAKGICQGTSVSDDLNIPEWNHDIHAEARRKCIVRILDAMTFQALLEISSTRTDE